MLQQHDLACKRHNCLNELTMQSRLMTEDENRVGKKSDWFRVNLTGPVKNFSRTLCQLTYITTLVIKNNNLERLPAELGNLINLVNLDASCNKLQSLPPTIGDLVELRALILNDNKIVELPFEIGRLLNLRHLNLNDNPLSGQVGQLYADGSEASIRNLVRYYVDYFYAYTMSTHSTALDPHLPKRSARPRPIPLKLISHTEGTGGSIEISSKTQMSDHKFRLPPLDHYSVSGPAVSASEPQPTSHIIHPQKYEEMQRSDRDMNEVSSDEDVFLPPSPCSNVDCCSQPAIFSYCDGYSDCDLPVVHSRKKSKLCSKPLRSTPAEYLSGDCCSDSHRISPFVGAPGPMQWRLHPSVLTSSFKQLFVSIPRTGFSDHSVPDYPLVLKSTKNQIVVWDSTHSHSPSKLFPLEPKEHSTSTPDALSAERVKSREQEVEISPPNPMVLRGSRVPAYCARRLKRRILSGSFVSTPALNGLMSSETNVSSQCLIPLCSSYLFPRSFPLMTLLSVLMPTPVQSIRTLSYFLDRISPSIELTLKHHLPWHTGHRKSFARSAPGLMSRYSNLPHRSMDDAYTGSNRCRSGHKKETSSRHSCPPLKTWTTHDRTSISDGKTSLTTRRNRVSSRTYATVAASSSTNAEDCGNSWLTPAEAARLGGKRHSMDQPDGKCDFTSPGGVTGKLGSHPSFTAVPPSSVTTAKLRSKYSVVSARILRESSQVTSNTFQLRYPPTVPYVGRRAPYALRYSNSQPVANHFPPKRFTPLTGYVPCYRPDHPPYVVLPCTLLHDLRTCVHSRSTSSDSMKPAVPGGVDDLLQEQETAVSHEPDKRTEVSSPISLDENSAPGVFVDLTGYDVTVSVERLPPVRNITSHLRGPPRTPIEKKKKEFLQSPVPILDNRRHSFNEESPFSADSIPPDFLRGYTKTDVPCYACSMSAPLSPPPPYSESVYSASSKPQDYSAPPNYQTYPDWPPYLAPYSGLLPISHTGALSCWTPYNCLAYVGNPHCTCPWCSGQYATHLPWFASHVLFPVTLDTCCDSPYCAREESLTSNTRLSGPFVPALYSSRQFVRASNSCSADCYSRDCQSQSDLGQSGYLDIPTLPGGDGKIHVEPDGQSHSVTRANSGWVFVPEPIRSPRSHDVYNALRTCLVPHYELRDYAMSAPPPRQWRRLEEPSKDGFAFTLMCYNLLSPNYATQTMYPYCPSWALSWDYRRRAILDEIRVYHANIICLQEVETNQFEEIFKPELEKLKYDAVFLPKSRRRTMDMNDGKKVDGCAIFWQVDKFEKLYEFHHEFMLSCSSMCDNPTPLMLNRVMTRDNVAIGVIFETKGAPAPNGTGGRQFCVTTGHIHWDPELSDVKMIQTILWTAELWAYINNFLTGEVDISDRGSPTNARSTPLTPRLPVPGPSSPAANMPVVLCGDLNSLPDSGVVEFLERGRLPKTHADFLNNGFKYMFEDWRLLEKWAVDGDTLRHRFAFDRAYNDLQGMRLTNFTYEFKGMIDYVLYTRQHFRLLGSLDQINESWFAEKKIVGCPHVHIPSDHFALLVELELKPTPLLKPMAARNSARNRCRSEGAGVEGILTKPAGGSSVNSSPPSIGGDTPNSMRSESVGANGTTDGSAANSVTNGIGISANGSNRHRKR